MLAGIEEYMTVPNIGVKLVERVIPALEDGGIHMWSAQQPAVQPVSPAVIRALNPSAETAFRSRTEARTAMTADVIKSLHAAGIAADHDNAFTADLAQEIIARAWNPIGAARAHPTVEKEIIHLLAEELRVGIVTPRQCF